MQRIVILLTLLLLPATADAQVETFQYTVESGDTCQSIAKRFYDHAGGCDLIRKYNRSSDGSDPALQAGDVIELPRKVTKAEALVDRKHGPVRARKPDADWEQARIGQELFRTWRVNTLDRARAELAFRDRSRLQMREQTLVIIFGGKRTEARRRRTRAKLQSGTLRSRLGELAGEGGMAMETPSAKAMLREGDALVDVRDEDGTNTTRVANHGGEPIEVEGRGKAAGASVSLPSGMGTKVERDQPPTPPKKLPPPPAWQTASPDVLSIGGRHVTLSADWKAVPKAAEYFVELTADRRGIEVIKSAYVPADVTSLEVQNVPPGNYWATVSSIDGDKFEGIPGQKLRMEVVAVEHADSGPPADTKQAGSKQAGSKQAGSKGKEDTPTFTLGTRLRVRGDRRCRLDDGEAAGTLRLDTPGRFELRCHRDDRPTRLRTIEVANPEVAVDGPDVDDEGTVTVARRGVARFDLHFDPVAPAELQTNFEAADSPEGASNSGIEVSSTRMTRTTWRLRLSADGPSRGGHIVVRVGSDHSLVRVPAVLAPANAPTPNGEPADDGANDGRAFRVGLRTGGRMRTGRIDESTGSTDDSTARFLVLDPGLVASFAPTPHFGAEVMAKTGFAPASDSGPWLEARTRALGRLPLGRVAPYLGAGFGVTAEFDSPAAPFVGAFLGGDLRLAPRWLMRLDGGVDLAVSADGEPMWLPGLHLDVLFRMNR